MFLKSEARVRQKLVKRLEGLTAFLYIVGQPLAPSSEALEARVRQKLVKRL